MNMKCFFHIREENRKFVVMGCNPGKSYEQALQIELQKPGCIFLHKGDFHVVITNDRWLGSYSWYRKKYKSTPKQTIIIDDVDEVYGLPLTLDRVIQAAMGNIRIKNKEGHYMMSDQLCEIISKWKFHMPRRWQEPVLEEQEIEIQELFWQYFVKPKSK
jgi:hypothetical protein